RAGQRHALEPDVMRRPDEHGDVEGPSAQQPVRMRGHRPGVQQPGVRRDERHQIALDVSRRLREMAIDRRRERARRPRIPGPGDSGWTDWMHLRIYELRIYDLDLRVSILRSSDSQILDRRWYYLPAC